MWGLRHRGRSRSARSPEHRLRRCRGEHAPGEPGSAHACGDRKLVIEHTQCDRRPCCVTVMSILSAKDIDVAVVFKPLMLDEADFDRAGNGAGVTSYSSVVVAIMLESDVVRMSCSEHARVQKDGTNIFQLLVGMIELSGVMRRAL